MAPGSLVVATANFDSVLATSTASAADGIPWPMTLGGATVTIVDSSGATLRAPLFFASPSQVNYRVPVEAAAGVATVRIAAGGATVAGGINIAVTYPGLFKADLDGLGISVMPDTTNGVLLYATGLNGAIDVTATINGVVANVASVGPHASVAGVEQIWLTAPGDLAGMSATVVVTAGGKKSNPVVVDLP